jgi:hypothetical protein
MNTSSGRSPSRMEGISDGLVKRLFLFNGSTDVERQLNKDPILSAPDTKIVFVGYEGVKRRPRCTAAALGSSCGEEACGLFGELFRKLEVRAVPGIRVEDQPGIR